MSDTKTEPQGELTSTLAAEIIGGVDDVVAESHQDEGQDDSEDNDESQGFDSSEGSEDPSPASAGGGSKDEETDEDPPEQGGLSEDSIERAVRLGIPLSEAKQYPSDDLLNAMCARIEGRQEGESGSQGDAGESSSSHGGEDDLLSAIPDLDPDIYDENIVAGFKSLKEIIKRQNEIIGDLRGGQTKDWFEAQLDGVRDFVQGDPAKAGAVREKFDVLRAGYQAAGVDVDDKSVFDEAAKLVLGSEMESAKYKAKGNAARRRSGQRIARPSGRRVKAKADPEDEIAQMLDSKFG